ncbi:TetR/AcrR family transcriptional regulator, partial [Nonomuraea sp. NPDC001023]
ALLAAAEGVLPAGRVRELHDEPAQRMAELVHRGQDQGVFRTDLPAAWLVSLTHYILHGAANEVRQGRLARNDAAETVTKSIQSVLAAPVPG